MAEFIEQGPIADAAGIREAVCIHTRKIFDSCREEDIAFLRFMGKNQWNFRRNSRSKSAGFVFLALRYVMTSITEWSRAFLWAASLDW